jgi:C-terminal processing protease CtpA/Prc
MSVTLLLYSRLTSVMVKCLSAFLLLLVLAIPVFTGESAVPEASSKGKQPDKKSSAGKEKAGEDKDKEKQKEKEKERAKAKAREREKQKQKALKLEIAGLVKQLEGGVPERRKAAEKRLAAIGKAAVGPVVKALGHDAWEVREAAQRIIKKIGKPAVPALKTAVAGKDLEVTTRAGALLKDILGEGYLGVGLRWLQADERAAVPDGAGATASSLVKDGPGAKGGVQIGDIIHKVHGKVVKDVSHMIETVKAIVPGTKVKLVVYRGRRKKELSVVLGKRPSNAEILKIERR